jgi:hypothetical protein
MELLIHNIGRGTPGDPDWNRGDIVMMKEMDFAWGRQEDPRTRTHDPALLFIILKVPGMGPSKMLRQNLVQAWTTPEDMISRGLWRVDLDNLPPGVVAQLNLNGGVATIGWGALLPHLIYQPDPTKTGEDIDPNLPDVEWQQ